MQKPAIECTPIGLQGALVLKLAYMMQFEAKILGNERYLLRDLCKMVKGGNKMLIDPLRRLTDQM